MEPRPHKVRFYDTLIPNYHKFPITGVGICENWFIRNYFVPFNSFLLVNYGSMMSLLYLKLFGDQLYLWNMGAAPVLSSCSLWQQPSPVLAAQHVSLTVCHCLHALLSEFCLRPEVVAPGRRCFIQRRMRLAGTALVQICQVHQAYLCPLIPGVRSSAHL